jgi:type I restriction enzyme, S subunit
LGIVNQIEHLGRSYAGVSVHQYHVVEVGDIVYTKSPLKANPYGIIKLNKHKAGIVSTLYAVYKVKEQNACGEWIEYYFSLDANTNRYLRPLVRKGAKNTLQISNEEATRGAFFVPKVAEQKRIALFFTVLDKKIAQLKTKKEKLQQYKKGVMQQLFSQTLRFKYENGKAFPKWDRKKLGEVTKVSSGGTPSRTRPEYWDGDIPWITTSLIDFDVIMNADEFITSDGLTNSSTKLYPKGTLLMAMYGQGKTRGKVALLGINATTNQACAAIIPNSQILDEVFLFQNLSSRYDEIRTISNSGGQQNLSAELVKGITLELPTIAEQIKIVKFLTSIDEKINRTDNQIQQTQAYKKGLLQNMFI